MYVHPCACHGSACQHKSVSQSVSQSVFSSVQFSSVQFSSVQFSQSSSVQFSSVSQSVSQFSQFSQFSQSVSSVSSVSQSIITYTQCYIMQANQTHNAKHKAHMYVQHLSCLLPLNTIQSSTNSENMLWTKLMKFTLFYRERVMKVMHCIQRSLVKSYIKSGCD